MDTQEFTKINKAGNWVNIAYIIVCFSISPNFKEASQIKDNIRHTVAPVFNANNLNGKIIHPFRSPQYAKR